MTPGGGATVTVPPLVDTVPTVTPPVCTIWVPPGSLVKNAVRSVVCPCVIVIAFVVFAVRRLSAAAGATTVTPAVTSGDSAAPAELLTVKV